MSVSAAPLHFLVGKTWLLSHRLEIAGTVAAGELVGYSVWSVENKKSGKELSL